MDRHKPEGKIMPVAKKTTVRRATKPAAALGITGETVLAGAAAAAKTPAKRTARKTAPPAHVTKQAAEVKAMKPAAKKATATKKTTVAPAGSKKDPMDKDWTYLQEKEVSELHELLAKTITQRSDIEITAKQVQAVLAFHPHFQRSKINKSRSGYVGLNEVIVDQRSKHMVQAHKDARELMAQKVAPVKKVAAKKAPAKRVAKKTA